ncbi:MAG: protoheme IX farnesyltransferase [Candidatus Heimdallarchaeota archaeon]|nr:protoheme IX farnesyltransferase [Candidatus Heimdallarchaeota archaeon]
MEHSQSFLPWAFWESFGELVKGKQTFLLIFTSLFAYLISGYPMGLLSFGVATLLVVSLFFSVSGSTLLNMYIDRDIDAKMERTKDRALPSGRVNPKSVLLHGYIFSFGGIVLALFINPLTSIIIMSGLVIDVVIYSLWLKRKTKWSIIFGGISGGMPALAGRTAIINQIDLIGVLFLVFILIWIPLHILTLATLPINLDGYRNAGVPMWPVASGVDETRTVITIAAFIDGLVIVLTGYLLEIHVIAQLPLIVMGLVIIFLSAKNFKNPSHRGTFVLFKFASMFMAMTFLWLFIAVVITPELNNAVNW